MDWKQKIIILDNGDEVESIAPYIISASRSTDIPAFYSKWFFNRLEKGYIAWVNPFNQKTQYVSLHELRFVVFWTKNPKPIVPYLEILDKKGIGYYFQITINDYENERLEPNVPELDKRIQTFISLSKQIGKHKTIWRFDPLLLSDKLTIEELLIRIKRIADKLIPHTEKLVFSFADINAYRKVNINLSKTKESYREFNINEIKEFLKRLQILNSRWGIQLATCAEDINMKELNISKNRCIDDELIYRINRNDNKLMEFLGYSNTSNSLFGTEYISNPKLKDKGQRKACGCIISKDIGMYNTCTHLCVYCYANNSPDLVQRNYFKHDDNSQSII